MVREEIQLSCILSKMYDDMDGGGIMRKAIILWSAVAILVICVAVTFIIINKGEGISYGKPISINQEEVFKTEGIKELTIYTDSTDIAFSTVKSNEMKISFKGKITTTNNGVIPELQTNKTDGKLNVQISRKSLAPTIYYTSDVQLAIEIPENYSGKISLTTVSGKTNIKNLNLKELTIKSVSGDVNLEQMTVTGVSLETTAGNVSLKGFKGNSGIKSVSGKVSIDYIEFKSTCTIKTIAGSIGIKLPQNAEFSVKAKTLTGTVNNQFSMKIIMTGKNSLEGTVGNGNNGKLELTSTSGDISISGNGSANISETQNNNKVLTPDEALNIAKKLF